MKTLLLLKLPTEERRFEVETPEKTKRTSALFVMRALVKKAPDINIDITDRGMVVVDART